MDAKLTPTQKAALACMLAQPKHEASAYELKANKAGTLATLNQLATKGLVGPIGGGHMAFPATGTWRLTTSGYYAAQELAQARA